MNLIKLQTFIQTSFFLLGAALVTSMAGLELSAALVMLAGIIYYFKSKKTLPSLKGLYLVLLPLLFFSLLTLGLNSHWSAFFKILGWYRWIFFFSATLYLLFYEPTAKKYLFRGLSLGVIAAFINSIIQYITGYDFIRSRVIDYFADLTEETTRITGFFNLPTTFGYILAMLSFIPLSLFIKKLGQRGSWYHGMIFLLAFTMLVLTHTRGAWLAFLGGLFIFVFLTYRKLILPISLIIASLAVTLFFTHSGFHERISSLTDMNYYSNLQRIELWKANISIFMDNPIIGVGLHQNDNLVAEYHKRLGHTENFSSHAHNSYLQFLAGTGLLGFFSFLLFLSYFPWMTLRHWKQITNENKILATGLVAIFCTFLICCLFDCNFRDAEVRYSFLTSMALLLSLLPSRPHTP